MKMRLIGLVLMIGIFLISLGSGQNDCSGSVPLFSDTNKIYPLESFSQTLTEENLPNILKTGIFIGNEDVFYDQKIIIGEYPKIIYSQSTDPKFGVSLSTDLSDYFYRTEVSFPLAIDFTHRESKSKPIRLFGRDFIVSENSNVNKIILDSPGSIRILLGVHNENGQLIDKSKRRLVILGEEYTIELLGASDTGALIKVTDSDGNSQTKEVAEGTVKTIFGLRFVVLNVYETNLGTSASLVIGGSILSLSNGQPVELDGREIAGTKVTLAGGVTANRKIIIYITAPDASSDFIFPGSSFIDPVFMTFKIYFKEFNINEDDSSNREEFEIIEDSDFNLLGNNGILLRMTDYLGNRNVINWAFVTAQEVLAKLGDKEGNKIHVFEREKIYKEEYGVIGNRNGGIWKIKEIVIDTLNIKNSKVEFENVFSKDIVKASITEGYKQGDYITEGEGTVTFNGMIQNIKVYDDVNKEGDEYVRLSYADGSIVSSDVAVIYPAILTSKRAKVAFYEPIIIDINDWDGLGNKLNVLRFPEGDGYKDFNVVDVRFTNMFEAGGINYQIEIIRPGVLAIYLKDTKNNIKVNNPALILFEEKNGNNENNAIIFNLKVRVGGGNYPSWILIDDVIRTWSNDQLWDQSSDRKKEADIYGTTVNAISRNRDLDIGHVSISYPDNQIDAKIYVSTFSCDVPGPIQTEESFIRGDADSNGAVSIVDGIFTLNYLFKNGPEPLCLDAADANDDGVVDMTDSIHFLTHLFLNGPGPPAPYPNAGTDPTQDSLSCLG